MLLMTSNGLTSRRLRKAAKKALPAGAKRAALVTTASVGFKEKDYHCHGFAVNWKGWAFPLIFLILTSSRPAGFLPIRWLNASAEILFIWCAGCGKRTANHICRG